MVLGWGGGDSGTAGIQRVSVRHILEIPKHPQDLANVKIPVSGMSLQIKF
jgi:hypothetical protein